MSICPKSKVEPSQTYKKFTQANANKHDAGCYSQLQKSELFFLNTKKGQRKKNGPGSSGSMVVGENQRLKS